MDFFTITQALNTGATNGSINHHTVAPLLMETFLPGYGTITRLVSQFLGFDIAYLVSLGVLLIALTKAWSYLGSTLPPLVLDYITSAVHIKYYDDLFNQSLDWIAGNRAGRRAKNLVASTKCGSDVENDYLQAIGQGSGELFHYANWAARIAPRVSGHSCEVLSC